MLNRKLCKRGTPRPGADRNRGLRHLTGRVGVIVVALVTALTGVAIAAPGASASTACVYQVFGQSNYYQACVADEQVLLNDLWNIHAPGPNQLLTVDGYYGPHTASDVRSFQTVNGLAVDGITGPQTWSTLCFEDLSYGYTGAYWHDVGCQDIV
jgi:peptidoglycan hydrolase-like protein with peptidoglycan-binding domain